MQFSHKVLSVVVIVALVVHIGWDGSLLDRIVRNAYMMLVGLEVLRMWRTGYIRRRPHWSRDSWIRFAAALSFPVAALAVTFAMAWMSDAHVPLAGASRSPLRAVWVMSMLVFMLYGAIGMMTVIHWLNSGEPARPFAWSARRFWRRA